MTPAERLQAAAERLEALDREATDGPWPVVEIPSGGATAIDKARARVSERSNFRVAHVAIVGARGNADLISALRPLAAPIARQLREHAVMAQNIKLWPNGSQHLSGSCGLYLAPNPDADEGAPDCECFTDALELADAVLAATGGAS